MAQHPGSPMAQRPPEAMAMGLATTKTVTTTVTYSDQREMWRVAVHVDGKWRKDEWFYGESSAWYYARWREALDEG